MGFAFAALLAGLVVGGIAAAIYDWHLGRQLQSRLTTIRTATDAHVETTLANAEAVATQRVHTLNRDVHERIENSRQTLEQTAATLAGREATLRELEAYARGREEQLLAREGVSNERATRARTLKRTRHELIMARLAGLAERAAVTVDVARAERLRAAIEDGSARVQRAALARSETRNLSAEATQLLEMVCARYDGTGHLERLSSTFQVQPEVAAALADEASEMSQTLAAVLACSWSVSDDVVSIQANDSAEREAARRLFGREWQSATAMRSLALAIKEDIKREIVAAGREAFAALSLPVAADEIVALVGRLKFRLSFSQNQWKHSIEVGRLAGMLAGELGLDRVRSRRGGLLHDMGKAMTHDHEGAHAILGASVARRSGEDSIVANAIGAHHGDEPMESPVAFLVTTADALSGARPGARRESATAYVARVREIHEIASRGPFVQDVHVMQAGREVRIHVSSEAQDEALYPLAQRIARALEDEVAFPGQIRVTVIRESRVSAIAR